MDAGEWRRFGYGMLCVHGTDFAELGGYNTRILGWGEEDVDLYERFVGKSGLEVTSRSCSALHHCYPVHVNSQLFSSSQSLSHSHS